MQGGSFSGRRSNLLAADETRETEAIEKNSSAESILGLFLTTHPGNHPWRLCSGHRMGEMFRTSRAPPTYRINVTASGRLIPRHHCEKYPVHPGLCTIAPITPSRNPDARRRRYPRTKSINKASTAREQCPAPKSGPTDTQIPADRRAEQAMAKRDAEQGRRTSTAVHSDPASRFMKRRIPANEPPSVGDKKEKEKKGPTGAEIAFHFEKLLIRARRVRDAVPDGESCSRRDERKNAKRARMGKCLGGEVSSLRASERRTRYQTGAKRKGPVDAERDTSRGITPATR
ncbi:hypothetical protein C8J57DRAFT_1234450 [Mycena rebaudengoi]|nr:hypothetical protein C8J57DRAFT_1234450 [Mycena rebaudengoi]